MRFLSGGDRLNMSVRRFFERRWVIGILCFLMSTGLFASDKMISMNFQNTDIDSVLAFLSDVSGVPVVKDPSLSGQISVNTIKQTSVGEAVQILNSVLSVKGYTLIRTGQVYKVVSLESIKEQRTDVLTADQSGFVRNNDAVLTRVYELKFSRAQSVAEAIEPMVGQFGVIVPYAQTNTLIVTDSSANLQKITALIEQLDRQAISQETRLFAIRHAEIGTLARILKELSRPYEQELGQILISHDQRTKTVFVTTLPENMSKIEQWISQLDRAVAQILFEVELVRVPYKNIGTSVRDRLFSATRELDGHKVLNTDVDQLLSWKYHEASDPSKMLSWYGFSKEKNKAEFMKIISSTFGADRFEAFAVPMLSTLDNSDLHLTLGEQSYFAQFKDLKIHLRMVPHINPDHSLGMEIYQKVSGAGLKPQEAYAQFILQNEQTLVLGGLNELSAESQKNQEELFRSLDDVVLSHEYVVFLTPHIIWDADSFVKRLEEKKRKPLEERVEKEDLNILFPQGFMEVDPFVQSMGFLDKQKQYLEQGFQGQGSSPGPPPEIFRASPLSEEEKHSLRQMESIAVFDQPAAEKIDSLDARMIDQAGGQKPISEQDQKDAQAEMDKMASERKLKGPQTISEVWPKSNSKEGYILKETLYRRGVAFYKKGQYKGAIREFAPIMMIDPKYKNTARYMQIAQERFQNQTGQTVKQQKVAVQQKQEIADKMLMVDQTMDQKAAELKGLQSVREVNAGKPRGKVFAYEGDPINIPSDRIKRPKTSKISGEVIEVSALQPIVVINRGGIHKVENGMVFRVFRSGQQIGKISITDVNDLVSGAEVIATNSPETQIQYGDAVVLAG